MFLSYHRQPKLSIRLPSDVTLAYKRCCVTKIRFVRVCMGTQRFVTFKAKPLRSLTNPYKSNLCTTTPLISKSHVRRYSDRELGLPVIL